MPGSPVLSQRHRSCVILYMQYLRIFIVVCLGLLLPACAGRLPLSLVGSRAEVAPEWSRWTVVQGGLMDDPARCARASRAVSRLTDGRWDVHAHVLDNAAMTAYSYADGHVFVTRGLVDAASDDELTAALAHELGHLLSDRHLPRGEYAAFIGRTDATSKALVARFAVLRGNSAY